jgi:hypothetical protein
MKKKLDQAQRLIVEVFVSKNHLWRKKGVKREKFVVEIYVEGFSMDQFYSNKNSSVNTSTTSNVPTQGSS